tara:strand:- start:2473 stop:2610 length:138 start_codon:yes stop_codon:yes gene_type:complete
VREERERNDEGKSRGPEKEGWGIYIYYNFLRFLLKKCLLVEITIG